MEARNRIVAREGDLVSWVVFFHITLSHVNLLYNISIF